MLFLPGNHVNSYNYKGWMEDVFRVLKTHINKFQGDVRVGISQWKESFYEMQSGINECRLAMKGKTKDGVYFFEKDFEKNQIFNGTYRF